MDGLIVRQPFADLLASGRKTWELRRRPLSLLGRFYILASSKPDPSVSTYNPARLGVAVAVAEQVGLLGPLSVDDLAPHFKRHRSTIDELRSYSRGADLYVMKLRVKPLERPRRYRPKPGAVTIIRDLELI